jgi:hypothetical protein
LSRGSYLYLFNNATENRGKIEIANHAGTSDQDAFSGYFDHVAQIAYSYKQPTLFTFTVDTARIQGHDQWHIPSYNERNEQKYLYKINTLDIYTWTEKDAATFLGHLKSVLPSNKLEIKDAPAHLQSPAEHRDSMSPVVQQLEKTAIAAQFPPRAESTTSANSLPGPPTPAASASQAASPPPAQAAPMAYNPAAPAAPEPIAHREKTPPPPDAGNGTGLANAGKFDGMPQTQYANVPNTFGGSGQPTPQHSYFSSGAPPQQQWRQSSMSFAGPPTQSPPPNRTGSGVGSLPPPPPPPGSSGSSQPSYNPSFAPPPGTGHPQPSSPPPNQANFNRQSIYGGSPGQTQYASYPQQTPSFGPGAVASPGLPGTPGQQPPTPSAPPSYSAGLPPPPPSQYNPAQPQQQQQPGVFAYSNYSYSQQQQPQAAGYNPANPNIGYAGDIHSQAYRPTEAEAMAHGKPAASQNQPQSETRQKFEGKVNQVEAGVGKFMKRLDKLW